jgi:hypothetical protein
VRRRREIFISCISGGVFDFYVEECEDGSQTGQAKRGREQCMGSYGACFCLVSAVDVGSHQDDTGIGHAGTFKTEGTADTFRLNTSGIIVSVYNSFFAYACLQFSPRSHRLCKISTCIKRG